MKFKEWMWIESQWISFRGPVNVNGIKCDQIDFRFEDYPKGSNPNKPGTNPAIHPGLQFVVGSFSAPLDDGRWLNYTEFQVPDEPDIPDFATYQAMKRQGIPVRPLTGAPKGQANIMEQPLYRTLPDDWAKYAAFYLNNHLVSGPEHPRGEYERYGRTDLPLTPDKQQLSVKPVANPEPIFTQ